MSDFKQNSILLFSLILILLSSCTVVRQGQFGVKRTLGKYNDKIYTSGLKMYNPFVSTIIKVSGQTENIEVNINIPSKEGLTIQSEVSILYRVIQKSARDLLIEVGLDYEETIILPVFRSAVADVTSKYFAKDMHSGNRPEIEVAIRELMMQTLKVKGIMVENVLLKSISLPKNINKAIEDKLEAEQQAQRMEFILLHEKKEAERKIIQAEALRDANKIITEGLTPNILQYKTLEAWLELSKSSNAKVIIGNGTVPMMMNVDDSTIKTSSNATDKK